jgi:glycosyltransferase involved in cell wall biosynthesis
MEVEVIGSMSFPPAFWPERFVQVATEKTTGAPRRIWTFEPEVIQEYTRQIERRLKKSKADAVFGAGSMLTSQLKTNRPIYFWSDATFACMVDYYFFKGKTSEVTFSNGAKLEQQAIDNVAGAFYASTWAAESAVRDYHADPRKIHVVPLGANLTQEPTPEEVRRWIEERPMKPCRFFFIGVDWVRKGGDTTLALVEYLTKQGLRCELTIAGCQVPPEILLPPYVKTVGFINNTTPEGQAQIRKHFSESHFLIVPSRAECFGLVFAEASAHGVPSLSAHTGGIPTVVHHGVNGFCPPPGPDLVPTLAKIVLEAMSDREKYHALAYASYQDYLARLNWKVNGLKIRAIMEENK